MANLNNFKGNWKFKKNVDHNDTMDHRPYYPARGSKLKAKLDNVANTVEMKRFKSNGLPEQDSAIYSELFDELIYAVIENAAGEEDLLEICYVLGDGVMYHELYWQDKYIGEITFKDAEHHEIETFVRNLPESASPRDPNWQCEPD